MVERRSTVLTLTFAINLSRVRLTELSKGSSKPKRKVVLEILSTKLFPLFNRAMKLQRNLTEITLIRFEIFAQSGNVQNRILL